MFSDATATHARILGDQSERLQAASIRQLHAADSLLGPMVNMHTALITGPIQQLGKHIANVASTLPPLPAVIKPIQAKPFVKLVHVLDKVEAALPGIERQHGFMATLAEHPRIAQDSASTAVGYAFNGGKASAHAMANTQNSGKSAALANAVAIADRTAASLARAASDASNPADKGMSLATTTASAVGDKGSLVLSKGGSLATGLGGDLTVSNTTSNSAATGGSVAYVGGTAVSASAGPGSKSSTASHGTAAADRGAVAATRADSITLGLLKESKAQGNATANSQAMNHGVAASQSLMEAFGVVNGNSQAMSSADATTSKPGVSLTRDKAVAIGLIGAQGATHTASAGAAGMLGFSVIDSVARAIAAGSQKACADAVTKTYSDLSTGPQIDLGTFILTLQQQADKACVASFKDQAAKVASQEAAKQGLPTVETISGKVSDNTAAVLQAATQALYEVQKVVATPLGSS